MKEITEKITDYEHCYICGSLEKRSGNSLHVWDIEYQCGCRLVGALGDPTDYVDIPCPNESKTSEEWSKETNYEILDPVGWDRSNWQYSFYKELITKKEFAKRLCQSTILVRVS